MSNEFEFLANTDDSFGAQEVSSGLNDLILQPLLPPPGNSWPLLDFVLHTTSELHPSHLLSSSPIPSMSLPSSPPPSSQSTLEISQIASPPHGIVTSK